MNLYELYFWAKEAEKDMYSKQLREETIKDKVALEIAQQTVRNFRSILASVILSARDAEEEYETFLSLDTVPITPQDNEC